MNAIGMMLWWSHENSQSRDPDQWISHAGFTGCAHKYGNTTFKDCKRTTIANDPFSDVMYNRPE